MGSTCSSDKTVHSTKEISSFTTADLSPRVSARELELERQIVALQAEKARLEAHIKTWQPLIDKVAANPTAAEVPPSPTRKRGSTTKSLSISTGAAVIHEEPETKCADDEPEPSNSYSRSNSVANEMLSMPQCASPPNSVAPSPTPFLFDTPGGPGDGPPSPSLPELRTRTRVPTQITREALDASATTPNGSPMRVARSSPKLTSPTSFMTTTPGRPTVIERKRGEEGTLDNNTQMTPKEEGAELQDLRFSFRSSSVIYMASQSQV